MAHLKLSTPDETAVFIVAMYVKVNVKAVKSYNLAPDIDQENSKAPLAPLTLGKLTPVTDIEAEKAVSEPDQATLAHSLINL